MSEPNVNAIKNPTRPATNVRTITSLAMLAAIAYVVMLLSKMLPQVSGFLQMDLKDTVICIGAFLFGPLSAAVISIVVAVVEMFTVSDTGPIGCIMNVLATCAFCCTAAFVYKKFHTRKGAVIGLALGTVCLTVVMLLWNYLITPIYMEMDREEIVVPMLIPVFLPFNLVKGGLNMALILLLYKPVVTALRKARLVPESHAPVQGRGKLGAGFLLFSLALLATFVLLALVLAVMDFIPIIGAGRGDGIRPRAFCCGPCLPLRLPAPVCQNLPIPSPFSKANRCAIIEERKEAGPWTASSCTAI